jgi:hypothetical protein
MKGRKGRQTPLGLELVKPSAVVDVSEEKRVNGTPVFSKDIVSSPHPTEVRSQ